MHRAAIRVTAVIGLLAGTVMAALADPAGAVPVPRPRPFQPDGPPAPSACRARLTPDIAVIAPLPPITGPGDCGGDDIVRLDAVMVAGAGRVAVTPPATLRCPMAEAIVHWIRDDVALALPPLGAPLRAIDNYASYECRGRNRIVGAKLSQHGLANALDVRSFTLADGTTLGLVDPSVAKDLRERLRSSACARFTTVLGPGSDGYHETHIHLDLAERTHGYRLCQWEVR